MRSFSYLIIIISFSLIKPSLASDYFLFNSTGAGNSSLMKSLSNLVLSAGGSPRTPPNQDKAEGTNANTSCERGTEYTNEILIGSGVLTDSRKASLSSYASLSDLIEEKGTSNTSLEKPLLQDKQSEEDQNRQDSHSTDSDNSFKSIVLERNTASRQNVPVIKASTYCCCPWFGTAPKN